MSEPLVLPDGYLIDSLDTVYPPMRYTVEWLNDWPAKDKPYLPLFRSIGMCTGLWVTGWYLVCEQGGRQFLAPEMDAHWERGVLAYTNGHAKHLLGIN